MCTWNRAWLLEQTLDHFTKLQIPQEVDWELIVVDNNSTDSTRAVVEQFSTLIPIRYIFEETSGKTHAVNTAINAVTGDYVIWTDDDVIPDPEWLQAYVSAFKERPSAGIFGGPIVPHFANGRPEWLTNCWTVVCGAYGLFDLGQTPRRLVHNSAPWGANYVVRSDVQRQFRYNARFGMMGKKRIGGYETEMLSRALLAGVEGWWVPNARVGHFIRDDQLSIAFLRRYFIGTGRSRAVKAQMSRRNAFTIFGTSYSVWKRAIVSEAKYWVLRIVGSPERYVRWLIRASIGWGEILENLTYKTSNDPKAVEDCK